MPLSFAIVTPSFNQAQYIGATIESVLSQHYQPLDYFVQDGGSADGTVEILRGYGSTLRWASEKDTGQSQAINRGFAKTTGEILGWVNSDDALAPNALREASEFLEANPDVAMVYGDSNFINARGDFICNAASIEPWSYHRLLNYSDFIIQPSAFFRRSAFEAVGRLDESLHYAMDYDLWLKLGKSYKIAYLPRLWSHYRWAGENKSAVGGWKRIEEVRQVAARHGRKTLPGYFRLEKVNLHATCAKDDLQHARFLSAAQHLASATVTALAPSAIRSLMQPRTWRVIFTGQILRRANR